MKILLFVFFCIGISTALHPSRPKNHARAVPDEVSPLYLELRDKTIFVSWSLRNPSGSVSGYKVSWNDGSQDSDRLTTETELMLDYPYNLDCFSNTSVGVTPYDENFKPVGFNSIRAFMKQDLVSVTLALKNNEIHASWRVECQGRPFFLLYFSWKKNGTEKKPICSVPLSGGNPNNIAKCSSVRLQDCSRQALTVNLKEYSKDVGVPTTEMFPAYDLEIERLESQSVTLTWQSSHHLCNVSGYNIFYNGVERWGHHHTNSGSVLVTAHEYFMSSSSTTIAVDKNRINHRLENLVPYTDYQVCLSAEFSQSSDTKCCIYFQTPEAEPGIPSSLHVTSNDTSLIVNWQAPTKTNGHLKFYTVRWYNGSENLGSIKTTDQLFVLEDPVPCVLYTITVTATTGTGEGAAALQQKRVENNCQNLAPTTKEPMNPRILPLIATIFRIMIAVVVILGCLAAAAIAIWAKRKGYLNRKSSPRFVRLLRRKSDDSTAKEEKEREAHSIEL